MSNHPDRKRKKRNRLILAVSALLLLAVPTCCCCRYSLTGEPVSDGLVVTEVPTDTPYLATEVPMPTNTLHPTPTLTPAPTATNTPGPSLTPTATGTSVPSPTPRPTRSPDEVLIETLWPGLERALGSGNRGIVRLAGLSVEGGAISVQWAINNSLTESWIRTGARLDVIDILQAVGDPGIGADYYGVSLSGTFSMVDVYGNAREAVVVRGYYSRETIERINWDSILSENVYIIADEIYVHPAFR